jgi:hypothetical protein
LFSVLLSPKWVEVAHWMMVQTLESARGPQSLQLRRVEHIAKGVFAGRLSRAGAFVRRKAEREQRFAIGIATVICLPA